MPKKAEKWTGLKKSEKMEWLRGEVEKMRKAAPGAAARSTKRLAAVSNTLSDKIGRLSSKVDKLSKELQEIKKKLETQGTPAPEAPVAIGGVRAKDAA